MSGVQGAPRVNDDRGPQAVSPEALRQAIDRLGVLDFAPRMEASRTVRRAPAAAAVPALIQAVGEHRDGYVRFRALVLLSGFNDPRALDVMLQAIADPNDRLREAAYGYFEANPNARVLPALLEALGREQSEFVRPALIRSLAAHGSDPKVRQTLVAEAKRGEDFFRSAVIEALGDYKAGYAQDVLVEIAKLAGPLQDDAGLALGKIGDKRALNTLVELQRTAPKAAQPSIATAICLLGVNCSSHQRYLNETLAFAIRTPGFQDLLRTTAGGLAALAVAGNIDALMTLLDHGAESRDPARAALALAIGTVALRNTKLLVTALEQRNDVDHALELLREAFDMLEEHLEEERFFTTVRRMYWEAPEGSPRRKLGTALIAKLEF
jgi:HEAT repeat protein